MSESQHPEPARTGKLLICPYCGDPQPTAAGAVDEVNERCRTCGGLFEPLSRQATHNAMGPWFVRDPNRPFQPGCSFETMVRLVQRGKITRLSILRGPTTRQFWTIAKRVAGIAHLLGFCHDCGASVDPGDHGCHACGVSFGAFLDRNYLGLPEFRPLPWERQANSDDPREAMGLTHDDPSARTWHGLPIIRESAARGGRLSSFATDEELRGEKPIAPSGDVGVATAAVGETPATAVDAPASVEPPPASTDRDRNTEVTIRLMRRKVARQQKTIYRLTILSTALAFIALVTVMAWLSTLLDGGRGGRGAAQQVPAAAEVAPPAVVEDEPVLVGDGDDAVDDVDPAAIDDVVEDELDATPIVEEPEPVDPMRLAEVKAEFDRAIALLEASRDDGRPLAEAIADCEEAIAILSSIKADEPREVWPAGLEDRLTEARRQHERLKLREFFP